MKPSLSIRGKTLPAVPSQMRVSLEDALYEYSIAAWPQKRVVSIALARVPIHIVAPEMLHESDISAYASYCLLLHSIPRAHAIAFVYERIADAIANSGTSPQDVVTRTHAAFRAALAALESTG